MSTAGQSESAAQVTTHVVGRAKGSGLGGRSRVRFSAEALAQLFLPVRLIVVSIGTFVLVTVAAGSGVINHVVGGGPISRIAAVIAPGAVVMAMIYAHGPLSGLHSNPAVTLASTGRRGFKRHGCCPTSPSSSPV